MSDALPEPEKKNPEPKKAQPERRTPREWAAQKGHIPTPGPVRKGGRAHRGPVFEHVGHDGPQLGPIAQHMFHGVERGKRWYPNSQITEAEYDAGVALAMGLRVGLSHPAPAPAKG